jgi:hypothetical protein
MAPQEKVKKDNKIRGLMRRNNRLLGSSLQENISVDF